MKDHAVSPHVAPERDDDEEQRRGPEDQQLPDRWAYNPWRKTREGTAARRISDAVLAALIATENRQRKRKGTDAETFIGLVDAVLANLLRRQLDISQQYSNAADDEKRGWVRIPLSARRLKASNPSRYDRTPMPLGMLMSRRDKGRDERKGIIEAMADLELIYLDRAPRHSEASRSSAIKCREGMLELIVEHEPTLDELELIPFVLTSEGDRIEPELIELREPVVEERWSGFVRLQPRVHSRSVEYRDDATTEAMRAEISRINEGLIAAHITFDPGNGVINGHAVPENGVALGDRTLKRIFNNGRWDHGGRLYGGFWQKMKRELRDGLRIDGQRVDSLDFSAMYLQLLYAAKAKCQAPLDEADLYEAIDREAGWPNDPEQKALVRDAVKKIVIAMLFDDSEDPRKSLPKGTRPYIDKRTKWTDLVRRMKERHPPIARWVGTDVGFELMHHESEIMIKTVLRCLEQGVVVLPIHDGLLVAEPHTEVARKAMLESFSKYTGGFVARISS